MTNQQENFEKGRLESSPLSRLFFSWFALANDFLDLLAEIAATVVESLSGALLERVERSDGLCGDLCGEIRRLIA